MTQSNLETVKQKVFTILNWFFTAFFLIMAFSSFKDKAYISFILLLLGGLLLLPTFKGFWISKFKILENGFWKMGLLFILFVVAFALNPNANKGRSKLSRNVGGELSFEEKREILINHIKNDTSNKSIQNIKKLGEIGGLFNIGNYATVHPHDGYITEVLDSISKRKLLLFNPRFDFDERSTFLKSDNQNGVLESYVMKFDIDTTGEIVSEKTIISYSKSGFVEFETSKVPNYLTFVDSKIVENQKLILEAEQLIAKTKVEFEARKKAFEEKCLSGWDGSHKELVKLVKKGMNDPSSFEHNETSYKLFKDYAVVVMSFRGKNAFGGTVLNSITAKVSLDDCSVISVEQ